MRCAIISVLIAFSVARTEKPDSTIQASVTAGDAEKIQLDGTWTLKIEDLKHILITTAQLKFSSADARSCIDGNWKKVIVISSDTSDGMFFPINETLSYELKGDSLGIGRNEVCDNYLRLNGHLKHSSFDGEYVQFGMDGAKGIGFFSLIKTGD